MKNSLICSLLADSLLASYSSANEPQTQDHLKALLGELMQLEQQLDHRQPTDNSIAPGSKYRIKLGDSLGTIARRAYGDTNMKLSLVMQLIVSNNPTAFFRNNQNFIYADKVISIPSVDDFRTMLFSVNTDTLLNDTNDKTHWIRFP